MLPSVPSLADYAAAIPGGSSGGAAGPTATLHFDGTDDSVVGTGQGAMAGPLTLAALVHRATTGGADAILSTRSASVTGFCFEFAGGDYPLIYNDNTGNQCKPSSAHQVINTTDWWIVAFSRGSGETPRFHTRNVTGGGSWQHGDGDLVQTTNPDSAVGGNVIVGYFDLVGTGLFDYYAGDIALIGWWNLEMTDPQVEALDDNLRTSDWSGHAAGAPASLTQFTSTTPTDLRGLVTWGAASGATATGALPAGWTFT